MSFKIIKPEDEDQIPLEGYPRDFLAGSIDNGRAEPWQTDVEYAMQNLSATIFNPRRVNWLPELQQDISEPEFTYQVNWELDHIDAADVVLMYFAPTSLAPISLMELGYVRKEKTVVVCCPEGYWRRGNVQVMCHRKGFIVVRSLDEAIDRVIDEVRQKTNSAKG